MLHASSVVNEVGALAQVYETHLLSYHIHDPNLVHNYYVNASVHYFLIHYVYPILAVQILRNLLQFSAV